MRILLADDSEIILDRLEKMLCENKELEVIGKANNSLQAFFLINRFEPDVAILDIKMPGGDGSKLLPRIKKGYPELVIIMLTNYNLPVYKRECLNAGAEYFLDKSSEFEKVIDICNELVLSKQKD